MSDSSPETLLVSNIVKSGLFSAKDSRFSTAHSTLSPNTKANSGLPFPIASVKYRFMDLIYKLIKYFTILWIKGRKQK
jgi:hypothetical protein